MDELLVDVLQLQGALFHPLLQPFIGHAQLLLTALDAIGHDAEGPGELSQLILALGVQLDLEFARGDARRGSEFFVAMYPAHQAQYQRRPLSGAATPK